MIFLDGLASPQILTRKIGGQPGSRRVRLLLADSVENSRPWFAQQKNMRPRLKSFLSAEASGLGFHVALCKKGVLTSQ
jgi:hypothetical protein